MSIYRYLPFIITLFVAFFIFFALFSENQKLTKQNIELKTHLDNQNKEIMRQKIELDNYKCDIDTMKEYAVNEYKKAFLKTQNDKTCEGKLKHLESILKSYE